MLTCASQFNQAADAYSSSLHRQIAELQAETRAAMRDIEELTARHAMTIKENRNLIVESQRLRLHLQLVGVDEHEDHAQQMRNPA